MFLTRIALILLIFSPAAFATDYWADVDASGSACTNADRCATIQEAVDALCNAPGVAGDRVCVADGTYTAGFTITYTCPSGSVASPIKVLNCEGGDVVINSGETVASWTDNGSNLYTSNTLTNGVSQNIMRNATNRSKRESDCGDLNADYEHCDAGSDTIQVYSSTNPSSDGSSWVVGTSTTAIGIEYVKNWEFDGIDVLYFGRAYDVGNAQNSTQRIDTENITIKNAETAYGMQRLNNIEGSPINPNRNIILDNMNIHHSYDPEPQNGHCVKYGSNFSRPNIVNTNVTIKNSTIHHCWNMGIQFSDGQANGNFYGNTLYDCSLMGNGTSACIRCGDADNCNIYNNDIYGGDDPTATGIFVQFGTNDVYIYNNRIRDFTWHGIYFFNSPGVVNAVVYNNEIWNNSVSGIRPEYSQSVIIGNNTLYDNGIGISMNSANGDGVEIYNNICHNVDTPCLVKIAGSDTTSNNNTFYREDSGYFVQWDGTTYTDLSTYQTASSQDANSQLTDPGLTNPSADDFSITTASAAATGSGVNMNSYYLYDSNGDPFGATPDHGADQATSPTGTLRIKGVSFYGLSTQ